MKNKKIYLPIANFVCAEFVSNAKRQISQKWDLKSIPSQEHVHLGQQFQKE